MGNFAANQIYRIMYSSLKDFIFSTKPRHCLMENLSNLFV